MQRLVTRTTTRHQTDLARPRCVPAIDDAVGMINTHLRPGGLDAEQRLRNDVLGVVDELLHSRDPSLHYDGGHASPTCQRRWPLWQPRARTSRLYADHFSSMRPYFQIDSAITQVSTNNATIA